MLYSCIAQEADRLVPLQRALEWCHTANHAQVLGQRPLPHYETSAKTALHVESAFEELAHLALAYEDYKRQSTPQLFVPPATVPIDLRRQQSSMSTGRGSDSCC
jgi:hypothetical protein